MPIWSANENRHFVPKFNRQLLSWKSLFEFFSLQSVNFWLFINVAIMFISGQLLKGQFVLDTQLAEWQNKYKNLAIGSSHF